MTVGLFLNMFKALWTMFAGITGRGRPDGELSVERLRRIDERSTACSLHAYGALLSLAREELDAGRSLPGPFTAVPRRTTRDTYAHSPELAALWRRIGDPLLNAGETWAGRALADAERLRGAGRRLL